jgi:hypothetical protein
MTAIPTTRHGNTGTAHPPLYGVPTMAQWEAMRARRKPPIWMRLFSAALPGVVK